VVNVDLYSSLNLISLILIKTNTLYFIIFRIFRLFSVAKKSGYQSTVELLNHYLVFFSGYHVLFSLVYRVILLSA
jgi:hypothetical protein